MTQNGQQAEGNNGAGYGGADGGGIRLSAIPGALAKQLIWAVPLVLVLTILSFWFTHNIKRQYVADGRILVQLGSEYVYNPVAGNGNSNSPLSITSDQVTLTELGIIKNSAILDEVINQMIASPANGGVGGDRFAPILYAKWVKASPEDKIDRFNDIVKMVDKSYYVTAAPKSSIVDLTYKHQDREVAVKTLDAFMTAYANFRKQKFVISKTGNLSERRADTEDQLAAVEAKIQAILNKNGISDFDTEQTGAQTRAELLRTQLNILIGQLAAAEASLASSEDQLRREPQRINLFTDDRASQRLAQAQLEKRQLLAKYLPTSNPVRAKEAEIRELQAQINSNGGQAQGGRRVGPNPVYQALLTQRNTFQATANSLREQEIILQRQVTASVAKVKRMRQLAPEYTNLVREKTTIEVRLEDLQARETEALVDEQQLENSSQNIKFITRPNMASKGRNMKKILRALAFLGSVFSVFMLALLRVFLDPKLYGPKPQSRLQQLASPNSMSAKIYNSEIPEAVPHKNPVSPDAVPMPAHMPEHAPAANTPVSYEPEPTPEAPNSYVPVVHAPVTYKPEFHIPATYGDDRMGYQQQAHEQIPYEGAAPVEMEIPARTQIHADGSFGIDNPYVSTAKSYGAVSQPAEYAGPEGNIPVLGATGPKPYS